MPIAGVCAVFCALLLLLILGFSNSGNSADECVDRKVSFMVMTE